MKESNEELIPVFMPSFAAMLARAEKLKGGPLSETEVIRIRNKAACIMMSADAAKDLDLSRGYRDVEPENCWADWHRLRTEMTGNGFLPRIVLCLTGGAAFETLATPILEAENVEFEFREYDERMVEAFESASALVGPSLDDQAYELIGAHERVLYVLSSNFSAQDALQTSSKFLRVGQQLLQSGATAIKSESSGIAHSAQRWCDFAEAAGDEHSDPFEAREALFRAYVQFPIMSNDDYYSCGMHLLGKPDVIISESLLQLATRESDSEVESVVFLFHMFCLYTLTECGAGGFIAGHTFRPTEDWPRLRVVWEECRDYDEDDFYFNPFGRWRFSQMV